MSFYEIDGVRPQVDPSSFVHPTASVIGDVEIGKHCYIGPHASQRGDFGRIVLEDGVNVQDGCIAHSFPGKDVIVDVDGTEVIAPEIIVDVAAWLRTVQQ